MIGFKSLNRTRMSSDLNKGLAPVTKKTARFSWDHRHWFHRMVVRIFNFFVKFVPFKIKYAIGKRLRQSKFPYSLIKPGDVVVQVGAPADTLKAGRSRGMYFSLFTGPTGKVVLVEPDSASKVAFEKVCKSQNINNIVFHPTGAWNEETTLKLNIDKKHPASNFTEGQADLEGTKSIEDYEQVSIPANSIDNILKIHGISSVDFVSITTNGSEPVILDGMKETIKNGVPYISLALTGEYVEFMEDLSYELYTYDDRGQTFTPK